MALLKASNTLMLGCPYLGIGRDWEREEKRNPPNENHMITNINNNEDFGKNWRGPTETRQSSQMGSYE